MKLLVTGAGGMLGRDLVTAAAGRPGVHVTGRDRAALDITDPAAVADAVAAHDLVVNAAAWTDVDAAETAEAAATRINGEAVEVLARACAAAGTRLIHVSTDYVFPGNAAHPYREDAPTSPVNAYGRSKLAGETAVRGHLPDHGYVVRTAWLYGEHGRNFAATMLRLAQQRETVDVVDDQRGQPTWSWELAGALLELAAAACAGTVAAGVYHATAAGETTWFGFARAVFAAAGLDPARVRPVGTAAFPRPAPRPHYSVLGHDAWAAAGLTPLAAWDAALAQAMSRPAFADLVRVR
jgi:dTDP-4-dehydrorhamnose reductase